MENNTNIQSIELEELKASQETGTAMFSKGIDLIKDVKVDLTVRLGDAEITVDELFNLKEGSVVKLQQEINTPIDIMLDDKVIARGELVVVDENFGVSVTEILHYDNQ